MKSLAVADSHGWTRYVAHQAYYSLVGRDYEWELMPLGLDQGEIRAAPEMRADLSIQAISVQYSNCDFRH